MKGPGVEQHLEFGLIRQADKIRIVLVLYLGAVTLGAGPALSVWREPAVLSIVLAALASVWSYFLLRWDLLLVQRRLAQGVAAMTLFDVSWLSLFALSTGGSHSPFWPLLLLPVIFSAVFFGRLPLAVPFAAGLVGAVYVALAAGRGPVSGGELWHLSGRLLAVVLVAWFCWALASVLERQRQFNQRTLRYLSEGVLLVDRDGTISLTNPRMAALCGMTGAEIVGRNAFVPAEIGDNAVLGQILHDVVRRPCRAAVCGVALEGRELMEYRCTTIPCGLSQGRPQGWVVVVQDVSDIVGLARMQEQTLGVISHELRSPLASLRVMGQLLGGIAGELSEPDRRRVAGTIEQETARLSRLVNDLLHVSRLEQPSCRLQQCPVDATEALQRVRDLFEQPARLSGITLRVPLPVDLPPVLADSDRLMQILTNLVDNAVKYTPAGGRVEVSAAATTPETISVSVTDTGPGIPADEQALVFEKFGQSSAVPAHGGEGPGLGLGLYMARHLARRMEGEVELVSLPAQGCTFILSLPRADGAAATPEPVPAGEGAAA